MLRVVGRIARIDRSIGAIFSVRMLPRCVARRRLLPLTLILASAGEKFHGIRHAG